MQLLLVKEGRLVPQYCANNANGYVHPYLSESLRRWYHSTPLTYGVLRMEPEDFAMYKLSNTELLKHKTSTNLRTTHLSGTGGKGGQAWWESPQPQLLCH